MKIQLKRFTKITCLCCAVALVLTLGLLLVDRVFVTQRITGLFPERTELEMIEKAHLIVKGTFEDRSKAFRIESANGQEESNFTDYTLKVQEVYRGDVAKGENVTVRTQGGFVGTLQTVADFEPKINVGDTVFIYLYQPNIGGTYETDGDYYYVLNGIDGLYHCHSEETLTNPATGKNLEFSNSIKTIETINKTHPVNKNWVYEELQKSLKNNLENGFITQNEYDREISRINHYGTVTKEALFK